MTAISNTQESRSISSLSFETDTIPAKETTPTNVSTIAKTHQIGLAIIIAGTLVGIVVVGLCIASGVGIAAVVAAVVPLSMVLALKTGAAIGTAVGLVLTPLALYLIKCYVLKRDIPSEELQQFEKTFSDELKNPLPDGTIAPSLGEYSLNDGFITTDSAESLKLKLELIRNAEQSIEIMPNYFGGKVMSDTLDVIEEQLEIKKSLQVSIIANSFSIGTEQEWKRFDDIKQKFGDRFKILFISYIPEINSELKIYDKHTKMVVVDEKYFILGGSSLLDCFSGEPKEESPKETSFIQDLTYKVLALQLRDHDLVGKGPLAKLMRIVFYEQYGIWEYSLNRKKENLTNHYFPLRKDEKIAQINSIEEEKKLIHNAKMKLIVSNPLYSSENLCTEEYQRVISKAKELEIGSLYFDPPPKIIEALDQALDNGADVKVLTNGTAGDVPMQNYLTASVSKIHYTYLNRCPEESLPLESIDNKTERKKIEVFEYQVPQSAYHAKVLVAKDKEGIEEGLVGSYNLTYRSDVVDDEAIVVFENSNLVHQLKSLIEDDRKLSNKITVQKLSLFEEFAAKCSQAFLFIG